MEAREGKEGGRLITLKSQKDASQSSPNRDGLSGIVQAWRERWERWRPQGEAHPDVVRPPVAPSEVIKRMHAAKVTTIWPSVLLCLTTGLRPIGTLRIKWTDINFETARLRVCEKGKERLVPLNPWVLAELKVWKAKSASESVVDLKDRTIHYWMNKIRTEQGLQPEATLQGCRRTFISMAMDRGVSAELVASIAGNSVAVIEKHYKDLRTMDTQRVADMMDLSGLLETTPHSKIHSKSRKAVS